MKRYCAAALLALLLMAAPPVGADARSEGNFAALNYLPAEGFSTLVTDTGGEEYRREGVPDAGVLESDPRAAEIAAYRIFFGGEPVLDAELRGQETAPPENGVGLQESAMGGGYFAVTFSLNDAADSEAFLTGLTAENLKEIQAEVTAAWLTGEPFSWERVDFIDAEKIPDGTDSKMCWAASAANALHYTGWGRRAKELLAQTMADTPEEEWPPMDSPDDLYEIFLAAFENENGSPLCGYPWFFNGVNSHQGDGGWAAVKTSGPYAYGTWRGFLPQYAPDTVTSRHNIRYTPQNLVPALERLREGAGLTLMLGWYRMGGSRWLRSGGHVVSVWGYVKTKAAGFSKEDYTALVISNSDSDISQSERRMAPNVLHLKKLRPCELAVTGSTIDGWVMDYSGRYSFDSADSGTYAAVPETVFTVSPYAETIPEESGPVDLFDPEAQDTAPYVSLSAEVNGRMSEGRVFLAGEPLTLSLGVSNRGAERWESRKASVSAEIRRAGDGEAVDRAEAAEEVRGVAAGGSSVLVKDKVLRLPAGSYILRAEVTPDPRYRECCRTNDVLELPFTVLDASAVRLSGTLDREEDGTLIFRPLVTGLEAAGGPDAFALDLSEDGGITWRRQSAVSGTPSEIRLRDGGAPLLLRMEAGAEFLVFSAQWTPGVRLRFEITGTGIGRYALEADAGYELPAPAALYVTGYDAAGRFAGVSVVPLSGGSGEAGLPEGERWRVMLLGENLLPLTEAAEPSAA